MKMRWTTLLAAALLAPGCAAGGAPAPVGAPVADPAALAAEVERATTPGSPRQVSFGWTFSEAGSRVAGKGVVRYVAPDRLRLDLFGPRGETYLAAALVGEEFRLPPTATEGVSLPSPALLWAALGVFAPPPGAQLSAATAADSLAVLRYRSGDETYEFRGQRGGGTLRLAQVERIGPSGVLETIRLEHADSGELRRTRYRDWANFRELTFELESTRDVESFPESIWTPGSGDR